MDYEKKDSHCCEENRGYNDTCCRGEGHIGNDQQEDSVDQYEIDSWDDLLKFTRRNYLKTVEELTKVQERTENSLKQLIDTGTSYSKESSNVVKEWTDMLNNSFGKFRSNTEHIIRKATNRAVKELNINIPFQREVEELVDSVQKNIKSIFDRFQKSIFID